MIYEVKVEGSEALVPLFRDEVEVIIRALSAWKGAGQIEADLAIQQLNHALEAFDNADRTVS